ncbi:penicillin-insensitive murein endopeptidase [Hansschlegelia plantiphila]|uniref:Penicillin-insensitive murein endopeptidase n=1 Tax=Hansschlegelia plantiphila TaxID=374655 RepID=A0A9W6MTY9_9HYPH|nr:penicillin-insensitive murein endopeptidase [Hansschlegelia plantiphila]GLK66417.1 penicillin-insensitive murein endopeptidase [Hansschlegelia plantiphila]
MRLSLAAAAFLMLVAGSASAQDVTPPGFRLPPIAGGPMTPAKELFGRVAHPSEGPERSIGFYSNGCISGAATLPLTGPTWQVMRPSRNRFYGRTKLIDFIERFSRRVTTNTSWAGILIGDMSQPRGGPMLRGHASHQIGLDVDVWLRQMPPQVIPMPQRETIMSTMVVSEDRRGVNRYWTPDTMQVVKDAATDPQVERVLVNPAIKKAICQQARGDRSWLEKVRPNWGHDYHMHVRLGCPAGERSCRPQRDVVPGEGCGSVLDYWFTDAVLHPQPGPSPRKPPPPFTVAKMPGECAAVLSAP